MRPFLVALGSSATGSNHHSPPSLAPRAGHESNPIISSHDPVLQPIFQREQRSTLVVTVEDFTDGGVFEHRVDRIGNDAGN
jgi:hypothetical protein